jgi:hypothetical protein
MLVGGLMIAFQDVTLFIPLFKKKSSLKLFGDGFFSTGRQQFCPGTNGRIRANDLTPRF